jgi:hypothetical protein
MPRPEQASSQLTSPLAILQVQQQCFAFVPGGEAPCPPSDGLGR